MLRRAVFLDRDGVINRAFVRKGRPYPPATLELFELLPGVKDSTYNLREAGFLIIGVTNQPDVATGLQRRDVVESMHRLLISEGICDDIMVCYHTDDDCCGCRKPKPGMLIDAAQHWSIDLTGSFMVGDRWRDIAAGKAVGCYTFFIDYQYDELHNEVADMVVVSLAEASNLILQDVSSKLSKLEKPL